MICFHGGVNSRVDYEVVTKDPVVIKVDKGTGTGMGISLVMIMMVTAALKLLAPTALMEMTRTTGLVAKEEAIAIVDSLKNELNLVVASGDGAMPAVTKSKVESVCGGVETCGGGSVNVEGNGGSMERVGFDKASRGIAKGFMHIPFLPG